MKSCLCCTSSSDDSAATCPACGEASWSSPVLAGRIGAAEGRAFGGRDTRTTPIDVVPDPDDVVITVGASASIETEKRKRSKKQ